MVFALEILISEFVFNINNFIHLELLSSSKLHLFEEFLILNPGLLDDKTTKNVIIFLLYFP